jgi:type IV secretion system protein VirB10
MSEQTIKPGEERETATKEWEAHAKKPILAQSAFQKFGGVAIAVTAITAIGIVYALKNSSKPVTQENSELNIPERKPVPKLKDQTAAVVPAVQDTSNSSGGPSGSAYPSPPSDDPMKVQREQMEMQRLEKERQMLDARMKSSIVAPNLAGNLSSQRSGAPGASDSNNAGFGGERGAQDMNSRFARSVSGNGVAVSKASQIDNLEFKILQGKFVEAVLEPRAVSDLPGMICATVQRDVYGFQGREALIPWGSRICGVYNADLRKGQERLFAVWNTLRRPDGVQVTLDSVGADQLGTAGMGGTVNTHFAEIFGASALLSIIGAGSSTIGVNPGDQYNSSAYYRQAVQQSAAQTSQQALQPYINIPPTVTVPAGSRIRILVNRDLDFTTIYREQIETMKANNVSVAK